MKQISPQQCTSTRNLTFLECHKTNDHKLNDHKKIPEKNQRNFHMKLHSSMLLVSRHFPLSTIIIEGAQYCSIWFISINTIFAILKLKLKAGERSQCLRECVALPEDQVSISSQHISDENSSNGLSSRYPISSSSLYRN